MIRLSYPSILLSLRQLIGIGYSAFMQRFSRGWRLMQRRTLHPFTCPDQQHFGALDDQLLNDLGLQRSQVRAAEYGILPGDQALHHTDAAHAFGTKEI